MPVLCEKRRLRARPQLKQNGVNRPFSGLAVLWSPADERVNAKQRRERRRRGRDGGTDRRDRGGRHRRRRVRAADRRVQLQARAAAAGRRRRSRSVRPAPVSSSAPPNTAAPGDPSSGVVGASGANLLSHPDSYAELGGDTFQTATSIGGLPYLTPLRITWGRQSAIAYKRDFGLGGGPVDGLPRAIDLWWQLAGRLGIPYDSGRWSGPVRIERLTPPGAAAIVGNADDPEATAPDQTAAQDPAACAPTSVTGVPTTPGEHARLLPNGLAAAPARRPGGRRRDHRRGQPDRGQAVRVRRGSRRAAVGDRSGIRLLEQRRASALRGAAACRSPTPRHRRRSSPSARPVPGAG